MIEFKDLGNLREVDNELISNYSVVKKLFMGGTGSCKLTYVSGVEYFDELTNTPENPCIVNFEIYPLGLVGRSHQDKKRKGFILHRKHIKEMLFLPRKGMFIITLNKDDLKLKFHCDPKRVSYFNSYLNKDWFPEKVVL